MKSNAVIPLVMERSTVQSCLAAPLISLKSFRCRYIDTDVDSARNGEHRRNSERGLGRNPCGLFAGRSLPPPKPHQPLRPQRPTELRCGSVSMEIEVARRKRDIANAKDPT